MKYVSCTCQSNGTTATITPVRPPSTKMNMKPIRNSAGLPHVTLPRHKVAIQPNTWIAVGTATAMLAAEIRPASNGPSPAVNMWCAHSAKLKKPTTTRATVIALRPTSGVPAMLGIMVDTMPAAGRKMM
jgi:hypothetical protein